VDTAIRIDGHLFKGAIELDPHARDWEHHGHAVNPDYEQVRLHVFFDPGPDRFYTRTLNHREVAQLHLDLTEYPDLDPIPQRPAEAHLGRCSYVFKEVSETVVDEILRAAARFRLERKARRLRRTQEIHGPDQALFEGMAEALGYRRNAFPLRVVSQRAPLSELRRLGSQEEIDAVLFGVAGFLEGDHHVESPHPDTTDYQRQLWSHWWRRREGFRPTDRNALPWRTTGTRPQNHPQRRLGALGRLVAAWESFSQHALKMPLDRAAIDTLLTGLSHPYWEHHYTLRAPSRRRLALIGTSRAHDALINQILPLRFNEETEATWSHYRSLPALQTNEKLKRAVLRLFGDHPRKHAFQKKAYQQQALLQIYDDFCLADASDCEACPFPEQLWRMTEAAANDERAP
jgi:hypothetical protein